MNYQEALDIAINSPDPQQALGAFRALFLGGSAIERDLHHLRMYAKCKEVRVSAAAVVGHADRTGVYWRIGLGSVAALGLLSYLTLREIDEVKSSQARVEKSPHARHDIPRSRKDKKSKNNVQKKTDQSGFSWVTGGTSVEVTEGVLKVTTERTDCGGYARLSFDLPASPLSISRKAILHYGNDKAMPKFALAYKDPSGHEHFLFSVCYGNLQYQDATNRPVHGTFLAPEGSSPLDATTRAHTTAGPAVIWDSWFSERIVYDSILGLVSYQREDSEEIVSRAPVLPAGSRVTLVVDAWGWWTGHSHCMKDLVVNVPTH